MTVLRFHSPNRPPVRNYFSRREQWRLLMLVMSLGVVLVLMRHLRQPEAAEQLDRLFTGGQGHVAQPAAPVSSPPNADEAARRTFSGVRPELFAAVRDNTYFRTDETAAWFHLLSLLKAASPHDLESATTGEVDYVQLVEQPHAYRGRLVTVRGTVRQVTTQRPAANDIGLDSYYRLVIQPRGGGVWPVFVYALELPPRFPAGAEVAADVAVTGFYFKNLSYAWRDGLGIAPVLLAKSVVLSPSENTVADQTGPTRAPIAADNWDAASASTTAGTGQGEDLRGLLALAGWDAQRLATFHDDAPLSDDERQQLLQLLRRLKTFDSLRLAGWTRPGLPWDALDGPAQEDRGEFVRLTGRVRRVERHPLSANDAARLEMPAYYECDLLLDGSAGRATILAARVPRAWQQAALDEPASVPALFIKRMPSNGEQHASLFVAKEVAWHPTVARPPHVSFGESLLGTLGMDVGLLDDVRNRATILPGERPAFFLMLDAAGRVGTNQLIRFAQGNLDAVRKAWAGEHGRSDGQPDTSDPRRLLAEEVLRMADEGRYSVAPLFNDANHQIGQLVVLEGAVRRAVRVEVGTSPDGGPSDVRRQLGIDHYYELELFTDDSQNYPVVCCVRELPTGFPIGEAIHEPVRLAGFFFKTWLYHTSKVANSQAGAAVSPTGGQRQFAPLLIGPGPVWMQHDVSGGLSTGLLGGGLFVSALAGIWTAAWWFARGDRQFRRRVIAGHYALPEGQSLDDLHLPASANSAPVIRGWTAAESE